MGRSPRALRKSPRTPRTTTWWFSRQPRNNSDCWASTPTIPRVSSRSSLRLTGTITDQEITESIGRPGADAAEPFHDFRHVARLDHLRCVGEQHVAGSHRRVRRHPSGRLSGPGPESANQQHSADHRPQHSHRQGPPGSGESGPHAVGMFVTATFHGATTERHATVPATAILHLHDREWVYTPLGNGRFRRQEVVAGDMLPGNIAGSGFGPEAWRPGGGDAHSFSRTRWSNKTNDSPSRRLRPGQTPLRLGFRRSC